MNNAVKHLSADKIPQPSQATTNPVANQTGTEQAGTAQIYTALNKLAHISTFIFYFALVVTLLGVISGDLRLKSSNIQLLDGVTWKYTGVLCALWIALHLVFRIQELPIRALRVGTKYIHNNPIAQFLTHFLHAPFRVPFNSIHPALAVLPFLCGLGILLISDYPQRRFGFFLANQGLWEIALIGTFAYALYSIVLHSRSAIFFSVSSLLLIQLFVVTAVFSYYMQGNKIIFSDDHPSFIYRLAMLREHFPNIPFFNTDWNGGYKAREYFVTGVLNIFVLLSPILYSFQRLDSMSDFWWYSYALASLHIVFLPWTVYLACRILHLTKPASAIAALLYLMASVGTFEWAFKYGTLGFNLSAGLIPLGFALSYAITVSPEKRDASIAKVIGLIAVSFLIFTWSLSALALIPLAASVLLYYKDVFNRQKVVKLAFLAVSMLIVNIPWMYTMFSHTNILHFLSMSTRPGTGSGQTHAATTVGESSSTTPTDSSAIEKDDLPAATGSASDKLTRTPLTSNESDRGIITDLAKRADKSLTLFRSIAQKINPLILLLVIPALLTQRGKRSNAILTVTILWLTAIAVVGEQFKPQLELRRLILPAVFLATIPIAQFIENLLLKCSANKAVPPQNELANHGLAKYGLARLSPTTLFSHITHVLIFGLLFYTPFLTIGLFRNRGDDKYAFAKPIVTELSEAIATYGGDGRVFFASFILHDLGATDYAAQDGGHVAPLPHFSGKELYAFDYYHSRWSMVDPIPASYRSRGYTGIEEFLNLINATAVVAFRREWRTYFAQHPEYRKVFDKDRFALFTREGSAGGFIHQGTGSVKRTHTGLKVVLESPEMVIKYRFIDSLTVKNTADVEISRFPIFVEETGGGQTQQVYFIGLRKLNPLDNSPIEVELGL